MIGAGNVAFHLSCALKNAGHQPLAVYNRTFEKAAELAGKLGCKSLRNLNDLQDNGGLVILAVSDDAIAGIAGKINLRSSILVHTSGSVDIKVLHQSASHTGVIYPLQTFSLRRNVKFSEIPLFIEANTPGTLQKLLNIGRSISGSVYESSSHQRAKLHLAAVFACNFTNHMYNIAARVIDEIELPFEILKPLILETASKINDIDPADAQTGPSIRNDKSVIKKHIDLLSGHPGYQKIYTFVSESIYRQKCKK